MPLPNDPTESGLFDYLPPALTVNEPAAQARSTPAMTVIAYF
ncbi:hypothetical protein [Vibrio phage PJN101]|nr:hypothetical protein [Vibrio phage PJN101]